MTLIGGSKVFIEPSNKYVEFVDLWLDIAKELKHRYFVDFKHFFVSKKCALKT
jgi:hypothetical protein